MDLNLFSITGPNAILYITFLFIGLEITVCAAKLSRVPAGWTAFFQLNVESNPVLYWFCFTTLCDWSRKLAPPSQPIRCKTKTNRDLVTLRFPALETGYIYLL